MSTQVDIAMIGGGNAGISLAAALALHNSPLRTVVIEPSLPQQRDCSWALWANRKQSAELKFAIKGQWRRWQVIGHSGAVKHHSSTYSYISLSAAAYIEEREASLDDKIDLVREKVVSVDSDSTGGLVVTDQQSFLASHIFDSRPPKIADASLRQHFLGWEIKTSKPIDDADIATLMDFRVDQSRGLHFIYVLPFSDQHLLIESTLISSSLEDKQWYRDALNQWLSEREIKIESTVMEEYGVIPMDVVQAQQYSTPTIGASSGAVRRSSGYAFNHIQQQTRELAAGIAKGNFDVPLAISNKLIAMDTIFNGVLANNPHLGPELFIRTAKALNGDQFARFMLGKANLWDWLRVIFAMPKIPFIRQFFRG